MAHSRVLVLALALFLSLSPVAASAHQARPDRIDLPDGWRPEGITTDGHQLFVGAARVRGGSPHLFVPVSGGYCFYVEQRSYGDSGAEPEPSSALPVGESEPLPRDTSFWLLPDGIRLFTPNPQPGPLQTSGGTLASLRQRRCSALPENAPE